MQRAFIIWLLQIHDLLRERDSAVRRDAAGLGYARYSWNCPCAGIGEEQLVTESLWEPVSLDTGEEWAAQTRNCTHTHTHKWVAEINPFPKFLAKLFNEKSKYLLTYNTWNTLKFVFNRNTNNNSKRKIYWFSVESYFKSRTSMTSHEYKKWTLWKMPWAED